MAIGESGRVVIEVEPELKRRLHAALALEQLTMKDWFIEQARQFVQQQMQPQLFQAPGQVTVRGARK